MDKQRCVQTSPLNWSCNYFTLAALWCGLLWLLPSYNQLITFRQTCRWLFGVDSGNKNVVFVVNYSRLITNRLILQCSLKEITKSIYLAAIEAPQRFLGPLPQMCKRDFSVSRPPPTHVMFTLNMAGAGNFKLSVLQMYQTNLEKSPLKCSQMTGLYRFVQTFFSL